MTDDMHDGACSANESDRKVRGAVIRWIFSCAGNLDKLKRRDRDERKKPAVRDILVFGNERCQDIRTRALGR